MIRAGVRTDSKIGGEEISNAVSLSRISWERAMAYSASVQTIQEEYLAFLKKHGSHFDEKIPVGSAAPDHTVPYGTILSRDAFTGTSCLATISLSLRDKSHSPMEGHPIKSALMGFSLGFR